MKTIKLMFLALLFMLMAAVPAKAISAWDVTGTWVTTFTLGGVYPHDMFLTQTGTTVSGNGGYMAGSPYSYAWNITAGSVSGNTINLTMDYSLGAVGTTMTMVGTINPDGTMSGTWEDNFGGHREGTWHSTTGKASIIGCNLKSADDSWLESWGTNRWQVQGGSTLTWWQNKPGKKGTNVPVMGNSIDYTYGCNGHQILTLLKDKFGSMMYGHWKFGLSSSVVEDFHNDLADGILDGMYLIETVEVPANRSTNTMSQYPLVSGVTYKLTARGTANAGDNIVFDPRYSFRTPTSTIWTDVVSTYEGYGTELLDLWFNGTTPWGSYNALHTYDYLTVGNGLPGEFKIYDVYYPNNTGNLYVDIYAQL